MFFKLDLLLFAVLASLFSFLPSLVLTKQTSDVNTNHHISHPTARFDFIHPDSTKGHEASLFHKRQDDHSTGGSTNYADPDYVNYPDDSNNEENRPTSNTQTLIAPTEMQRRDANAVQGMDIGHGRGNTNTVHSHRTPPPAANSKPSTPNRASNLSAESKAWKSPAPHMAKRSDNNDDVVIENCEPTPDTQEPPAPTPIQRRDANADAGMDTEHKRGKPHTHHTTHFSSPISDIRSQYPWLKPPQTPPAPTKMHRRDANANADAVSGVEHKKGRTHHTPYPEPASDVRGQFPSMQPTRGPGVLQNPKPAMAKKRYVGVVPGRDRV